MSKFLRTVPDKFLLLGPSFTGLVGAFLNQVALVANNGQMPVLFPGGCDKFPDRDGDLIHTCMTHASHLKVLSDWINLHVSIMSLGDLLLLAGESTFWYFLVAWGVVMIKRNQP